MENANSAPRVSFIIGYLINTALVATESWLMFEVITREHNKNNQSSIFLSNRKWRGKREGNDIKERWWRKSEAFPNC